MTKRIGWRLLSMMEASHAQPSPVTCVKGAPNSNHSQYACLSFFARPANYYAGERASGECWSRCLTDQDHPSRPVLMLECFPLYSDRTLPSCATCLKSGRPCEYPTSAQRPGPKTGERHPNNSCLFLALHLRPVSCDCVYETVH